MSEDSAQDVRRVQDVMVRELHVIDGLATIREAIAMMKQHDVSSLVVARRDTDDEVGLVEVVDLAQPLADDRPPDRVHVYEVMSKPVVTLPPGMVARYAVRLLSEQGLSRSVVVDEKRDAVGIVTLRDLVLGSVPD